MDRISRPELVPLLRRRSGRTIALSRSTIGGTPQGCAPAQPFRLEDCADDAADVATQLGIERFIPVGYSMGGPIAQLIWRRHPERVEGMVLCATAPFFSNRRPERLSFAGLAGLAALARYTPEQAT